MSACQQKKRQWLEIGRRDQGGSPARRVASQHSTAEPYCPGPPRGRVQGRNPGPGTDQVAGKHSSEIAWTLARSAESQTPTRSQNRGMGNRRTTFQSSNRQGGPGERKGNDGAENELRSQ